ncbi:MAG: aldehyde dehydrogenase family protein [Bacillota bacterium]
MKPNQLFINGKWQSGKNGRTFEVQNPSDESTIGIVAEAEIADVKEAMEAAYIAQKPWELTPILQRATYFKKLIALTLENKEKLATLLTVEQGKRYVDALGEVDDTIAYMESAIANIGLIRGDILPTAEVGEAITVEKVPYGVVVALCAWNYPLALVGRKIAPALITGNTVVLKPHELTPLTTIAFFELIEQAGFPEGVMNLITGTGTETGQALVTHKHARLITLTGSVGAGKAVYEAAAGNVAGLILELGGKAPFIVLEDADIDLAVEAAVASRFANCGQICICCDMIFVQESIKDMFTEKLLKKVGELKVGDPMDSATDMGPKMCQSDIDKMNAIVEKSVTAGAKILCGGGKPKTQVTEFDKGYWYAPTVLGEVTMDMAVAKEEIFGPLLPVIAMRDFNEVFAYTKASPYGLACYLFTKDEAVIRRAMSEIEVGTIFVNRAITGSMLAYHGGHKLSGLNGEDGEYGMQDFLQKKVIYRKYEQASVFDNI